MASCDSGGPEDLEAFRDGLQGKSHQALGGLASNTKLSEEEQLILNSELSQMSESDVVDHTVHAELFPGGLKELDDLARSGDNKYRPGSGQRLEIMGYRLRHQLLLNNDNDLSDRSPNDD